MAFDHDTYLSPLTWRYGSEAMRRVWSERHKRLLLRRFWVALATAEHEAGLVTAEQLADLIAHQQDINLERAAQIEAEIRHDLMAEIRVYAEQCPVGGGVIHLGATSTDVLDNVEALRLREALDLLLAKLAELLRVTADQVERYAGLTCLAFTHLQPAEPTTVGYRLAQYGYDLLVDWQELQRVRKGVRGKGLRGAVGTSASYSQLVQDSGWTPARLEQRVLALLELDAHPAGTQVYPRKQDWLVLNALAGQAQSVYRLAFDLRLLQAPTIGEWSEPFGAKQVGSSAMPFKRNPIDAESLDSLARQLAALPRVAWDNAAHSLLERTLDDSANRRMLLPEAFLLADELVVRATRVVQGLVVREEVVARNLATYGIFAATERLLMEAVKAGGDRQGLHEVIREHSLAAWDALRRGEANPLAARLRADPRITEWLLPGEIISLLDASDYVGDAAERARALAEMLREAAASGVGASGEVDS
jgi:adenylosuccinate lyase